MWIMTTAGFLSVVSSESPDILKVRSRDRQSLQALVDGIEMLENGVEVQIFVGEGTDYPYRVYVPRVLFAEWVALEIIEFLRYGNFKSELGKTRGSVWSKAASEIWSVLWDVTDAEGYRVPGTYNFVPEKGSSTSSMGTGKYGSTYYGLDAWLAKEYGTTEGEYAGPDVWDDDVPVSPYVRPDEMAAMPYRKERSKGKKSKGRNRKGRVAA